MSFEGIPGAKHGAAARARSPVALALEGVAKSAGKRCVVTDVSASFRCGELTVIRASRGEGKTTLARLLAGQTYPDRGRIWRRSAAAPLVGAAWGFRAGSPVWVGLELRAAGYGLPATEYIGRIERILENPKAIREEFGQLAGRDRAAIVYASSWLVPSSLYVVDGTPLPTDKVLRPKLKPLFEHARRDAAIVWITDSTTRTDAYEPAHESWVGAGRLHFSVRSSSASNEAKPPS
jgi:hypothetical protein